jgi:hypothetical protein
MVEAETARARPWLRQAVLAAVAVPVACLVAALAVLGTLNVLLSIYQPNASFDTHWGGFAGLVLFCTAYAAVPAIPMIVLTEVLRLRRWFIYPLLGVLCGALAYELTALIPDTVWQRGDRDIEAPPWLPPSMGLVGGIVYWVIAGRSAGSWRPQPAET